MPDLCHWFLFLHNTRKTLAIESICYASLSVFLFSLRAVHLGVSRTRAESYTHVKEKNRCTDSSSLLCTPCASSTSIILQFTGEFTTIIISFSTANRQNLNANIFAAAHASDTQPVQTFLLLLLFSLKTYEQLRQKIFLIFYNSHSTRRLLWQQTILYLF